MKPLVVLSCLAAVAACTGGAGTATAPAPKVEKPAVLEFYVMSQCPYGVQVEQAVGPVLEQLGPNVDFKLNFIGSQEGGKLSSMHGDNEVAGDKVQLCAAKYAPDKYFKMVTCQNQNPREVNSNWEKCAADSGIDSAQLKTCLEGDEGAQLLAASFTASEQRGAQGSPTMYLNGKPYEGGRKGRDFLRALCGELADPKPAACTSMPEAVKVSAIFFTDQRCAECNLDKLEPQLKGEVPGLEVKRVDYMTDEGKKLYADLQAAAPAFKMLPTVLFGKDIDKDTDAKTALQKYLSPVGEYYALALGGSFDPKAEICTNTTDDDGDGSIDCTDSECKDTTACRAEKPKSMELFVMSQCPYGAKAMMAMKDVVGTFKKDLALDVYYIGDDQGGNLSSMHGPTEVEEDIRQVCVIKNYKKDLKFVDYLACRSGDYRSPDWEKCTGSNGIDAGVVKKCAAGEGKDLLAASFKTSASLNMTGSPTFLANGKYEFNAVDAAGITTNFCKYNTALSGCSASK